MNYNHIKRDAVFFDTDSEIKFLEIWYWGNNNRMFISTLYCDMWEDDRYIAYWEYEDLLKFYIL